VIDAMGDKGDCQREHQYRKLAERHCVIVESVILQFLHDHESDFAAKLFQLPNYKIAQLPNFSKELHAEE
jgi:hypothetical protein